MSKGMFGLDAYIQAKYEEYGMTYEPSYSKVNPIPTESKIDRVKAEKKVREQLSDAGQEVDPWKDIKG